MLIVTISSKNIIKIFEHMIINDFKVGDFYLNCYTVELLKIWCHQKCLQFFAKPLLPQVVWSKRFSFLLRFLYLIWIWKALTLSFVSLYGNGTRKF